MSDALNDYFQRKGLRRGVSTKLPDALWSRVLMFARDEHISMEEATVHLLNAGLLLDEVIDQLPDRLVSEIRNTLND